MQWRLVQLLGFLFLASYVAADEAELDIPDDITSDELEDVESILREIEAKHVAADHARENKVAADAAAEYLKNTKNAPFEIDPCKNVHCGAGRVCKAENKVGTCVCVSECPEQTDPRRKVCSKQNETWNSDCELHRARCLCEKNDVECKSPELKHLQINYYGECKEMPNCTEEEMSDFPRRMRDWLFNVMRDLAQRDELPARYNGLHAEAESNLTLRWANAAVWKWCDLDGDPHDRSISIHELFPIRAPLVSLEHCIEPFLQTCDPDNDHRITLKEWGNCLQLDEDDMKDRCDDISGTDDQNAIVDQNVAAETEAD